MSDTLLAAFESHSPDDIRAAIAEGVDPVEPINDKRPIDWLITFYTRSSRFAECLRTLLDAGARLDDPLLKALLLDDANRLRDLLQATPTLIDRSFSLDCAYTSLQGVSALHVCAEYNSIECARILLDAGLPINVPAAVNADGVGGHTPLFHTVNSNRNFCRPMMELLVEAGARLDVRVGCLAWGLGHDWETAVFDVTPISYAQCGLYPQFHRSEEHIYSNIAYLLAARDGKTPPMRNVPNRYVGNGFDLNAARQGQGAQ